MICEACQSEDVCWSHEDERYICQDCNHAQSEED